MTCKALPIFANNCSVLRIYANDHVGFMSVNTISNNPIRIGSQYLYL